MNAPLNRPVSMLDLATRVEELERQNAELQNRVSKLEQILTHKPAEPFAGSDVLYAGDDNTYAGADVKL